MSEVFTGYHESPYLSGPEAYMGGSGTYYAAFQATVGVTDALHSVAFQAGVNNVTGEALAAFQGSITINGALHKAAFQGNLVISDSLTAAYQSKVYLDNGTRSVGMQASISRHLHYDCDYYLNEDDYLTTPYHVGCQKVPVPFQANIIQSRVTSLPAQATVVINDSNNYAFQSSLTITKTAHAAFQALLVGTENYAFQGRIVIYNTTNLRILTDFASRGTNGLNWTANSTEPGDFSVNNLNTDIVEQVWRSATGVITGIELICDTGVSQGIFMDTLAILNHNLSGSASIFFDGSNSPSFATTDTVSVPLERPNAYYIAPTLPLTSYRYWRLRITDTGNIDGFIRIGTVLFGSSIIFSGESFTDVVKFGRKQYADGVFTEAFTNVKNDRGQKKFLGLDFRQLDYNMANFRNLRAVVETQGTILKSLWIPTPAYASRFAVFGKLTDMPTESHNDRGSGNDYVDVSINVDEAE